MAEPAPAPTPSPTPDPVIASTVSIPAQESTDQDGGEWELLVGKVKDWLCLLYTSPSPRDKSSSRMPSSA